LRAAAGLLISARLLPETCFNTLFFWLLIKTRTRRIDRGELHAGVTPANGGAAGRGTRSEFLSAVEYQTSAGGYLTGTLIGAFSRRVSAVGSVCRLRILQSSNWVCCDIAPQMTGWRSARVARDKQSPSAVRPHSIIKA
jgi:hypothetical protein